jgi:hypothetical protein
MHKNAINLMNQKKAYRKRVILMKCREYSNYYGKQKHISKYGKKADQILDVIYECIYNLSKG